MDQEQLYALAFAAGIALGTIWGVIFKERLAAAYNYVMGTSKKADSPEQVSKLERPPFRSQSEVRRLEFVTFAKKFGLTKEQALVLYEKSGAAEKDPVTGFDKAQDRKPTVARAIEHVRNTVENAFYVEVDIRNLGGLNAELGHNAADKIYANMAKLASNQVLALKASVSSFRHGGDEFSFLIVGFHISTDEVNCASTSSGGAD